MSVETGPSEGHGPPPATDDQLYHRGWQRWIASNLLNNIAPRALVLKMVGAGFSEDFAWRELEATVRSPIFEAALELARGSAKQASLLEAIGHLEALAPPDVPRVRAISPERFRRDFLARNRPVVVEGLASDWRASSWTFPYLAEAIGDVEVEVARGRDADPRYEDNFLDRVARMAFGDLVAKVMSGEESNDAYLVSKNRLLRQPCAAKIAEDIPDRIDLLGDVPVRWDTGLWLGPAGTVTPLHHDACNILFVQIIGRKRIQLIAPAFQARLYNDRNCFTDFDPEHPDFGRFPRAKGVPIAVVELGPGDAVLLPVGWWHHVRALDASVSLSMPRFDLPRGAHVWNWREALGIGRDLLSKIANRQ